MSGELERLAGGRRGHFAFPSGFHGDLWLELDRLFVDPRAPFVGELARRLPACDVVCGPMAGGALLAQLVARELGVGFAWSELPEYAIPAALHDRVRGRRVVVVDDAVNAGSAVSATIDALGGAEVVGVGALMVLGGGYDPGVPFVWLERVESGLWPAASCPLCEAGVPVDQGTAGG
jgi:orotate phosphoribosyltransferase